ncbi:Y-family DNA polymerase [Bowmanella dokdonensis]|uniref:DNA polymerase Y family protein n=1 Tax=Bowmanella dokdonensis TaxID=751969 RepID=A0A939DRN0_9ALTE|nr:DNA polymerase Y family protein [Bowmanella dokdonensis]MBN7827703.1 DNA polymerase Y family protein [Bowmanella dokdonensis]
MQALWLYLHFPSLQLDTLYTQQSLPLAVLNKEKNQIVQLNQRAMESGLSLGMGLGTAAALSRDVQILEYKQDLETGKLTEIARWLYFVTSDIAFCPPNGLLLRIHHMLSLYGGLEGYWEALKSRLEPLAVKFQYACGLTPQAARMLARAGHNLLSQDRNLLSTRVAQCSLEQAELVDKTRLKLSRVGVKNVGELLAVPATELARRFDMQLVTYLGQLSGLFHMPVDFYHPPAIFDQSLELMYEIESSPILLHPIKRLLKDLQAFLRLRDKLTDELLLLLSQRDAEIIELKVNSAQGEYQLEKWLELINLKLTNLPLQQPVYALRLVVRHFVEPQGQSNDLFSGRQGQTSVAQLLSVLQARLGPEAVSCLQLNDDFRPELSTRYAPPLRSSGPPDWPLATLRPAFLLEPPQPLREKVRLLHGPERIQTGWWDGHAIDRDYFIARNTQGQWLWIFRTRDTQWYVQGLFS